MEKIKYYNETKRNQDELVSLLSEQTLPAKKMIISISSIVILFIILILNWDKENPSMYILLTVLLAIGLIGLILLLIGKKWLIKISNKNLANGDEIFITDETGTKVKYIIYNIYTTTPEDSDYMDREVGEIREVTLVTCTDDTKSRLIICAKEA